MYTTKQCPYCDKLKEALKTTGINFEERDIETKEAIIDLRYLGCFPQEAPVLRIGMTCFESPVVFREDGEVNEDIIQLFPGRETPRYLNLNQRRLNFFYTPLTFFIII